MISKIIKTLKSNGWIVLIIVSAFVLRTVYGMCINFDEFNTLYFQDYTQIYLLGLKFYTTGIWPYWGPDITYTASQMPGAMQGLLVGLPFFIFQSPLAPFIFLNVLSASALVFFAWYISKRITGVPKWFVYAWLLTAPWTTNYSTTVVNPSYVLAPTILFFISIIELLPIYTKKIMSLNLSFFFIGFSLGWILQIYMSWVLLPFYILLALVFVLRENNFKVVLKGICFFVFGFLITISTLLPTFIKYGFATGGSESAIILNLSNLKNVDIITRFVAFSTYEAFHFMSGALVDEKTLLFNDWWATPFILILAVVGIVQTIYYITFFFRKTERAEFKKVKIFVLGSILLIYVSYIFTVRDMASYTFYMFVPVSFWFSFYCIEHLFKKVLWKRVALFVILSGIVYHVALARGFYATNSLFSKIDLVNAALKNKDSRLFAYRRVANWEQNERMKAWKNTNGNSWFNNFDSYSTEILPENLSTQYFVSAPYSCRIDSVNKFSVAFTKSLKDIGDKRKARISFYSRYSLPNDAALAISISNRDTSLYWWNSRICENCTSLNKWEKTTVTTEIPEIKDPEAKFEIFIFLQTAKNNEMVFIDDFKIDFY